MFVCFFYRQKARPAASPSPYAFEFRGKLVKNELVGLYMSSVKKGRDKNSFRECALNSSYLLEHLNATKKMGYFSKFTTGQKTCWLCVNCGTKSHVTTSLFLFEISPNLRTIKAVSQPSSLSLSFPSFAGVSSFHENLFLDGAGETGGAGVLAGPPSLPPPPPRQLPWEPGYGRTEPVSLCNERCSKNLIRS